MATQVAINPHLLYSWNIIMRLDIETSASEIEQSIGLLRRRL